MFFLHRCPLQDVYTVFYSKLPQRHSDLKTKEIHQIKPKITLLPQNTDLLLGLHTDSFLSICCFCRFVFFPGIPNSSSIKVGHKPTFCTRKVKGRITACYSTKNPANGYDFPKYNQVSGWLAGWLDGCMTKEKLCIVSLPVKIRQTLFLTFELQVEIYRYLLKDKTQQNSTQRRQFIMIRHSQHCLLPPFPESVLWSLMTQMHSLFKQSLMGVLTCVSSFYPGHMCINSVRP